MAKRKSLEASSREASSILEELYWLLKGGRLELLKQAAGALRDYKEDIVPGGIFEGARVSTKEKDANKRYLIGALPFLFEDKELFPKNADIADFAKSTLGLNIRTVDKRGRYELIGIIAVETVYLNEDKLDALVRALAKLTGESAAIDDIKNKKKIEGISWSETIKALSGLDDE